tara:strand:- start:37907 stop:39496 length:1590 start_codon:yes stop_codon:yes gene_type:complete
MVTAVTAFQVLSTILYSATYLVAAMFFLTQWQTPPVGSLFGPKVQLLLDMFGIVASTVLLFGFGLQAGWVDAQGGDHEEFDQSKEHTRDASGMLLFVMVIASAAGDTSNFWMIATACLLGACRLLSKWEYVVLDADGDALDFRGKDLTPREASPMQNFVVTAILSLVLGNEIDLGTRTIGYPMLGAVAGLQLAIGVYKLVSSESNKGRIQFEATVMSMAHFGIISFYALQIDAPRTLATAVAVAVADGLANISTESSRGSDNDKAALLEHLLGAAVSVGSTVISYILFQEYAVDLTWLSVVSTISLCAAVARTLTNLTSAFEGKRRQSRLYGYIGNGATLSLCVAGAIQLVYAIDHEKNLALSVGAVSLAVLNRVADFFQFPEETEDRFFLPYASTEHKITADTNGNVLSKEFKATEYNLYKRVQMVVLLGGAFTCMLMTTIGEGGVQWVEIVVTIGLGIHALSAVLSLFQGCCGEDWFAVSSMEVIRLPVSTLLVGLLSAAADKNTVDLQVLALSLYIVADMVGRFFL